MGLSEVEMLCSSAKNREIAPMAPCLYRGQTTQHYYSSFVNPTAGVLSLMPSAYRETIMELVYREYHLKDGCGVRGFQREMHRRRLEVVMSQSIVASVLMDVAFDISVDPLEMEHYFESPEASRAYIPHLLQHYGLWGLSTDFTSDPKVAVSFALGSRRSYPSHMIIFHLDIEEALRNLPPCCVTKPENKNVWVLKIPSQIESIFPPTTIIDLKTPLMPSSSRVERQSGYFVEGLYGETVFGFMNRTRALSFQIISIESEQDERAIRESLGEKYTLEYLCPKDAIFDALLSIKNGISWKRWHTELVRSISSLPTLNLQCGVQYPNPLFSCDTQDIFRFSGLSQAFRG